MISLNIIDRIYFLWHKINIDLQFCSQRCFFSSSCQRSSFISIRKKKRLNHRFKSTKSLVFSSLIRNHFDDRQLKTEVVVFLDCDSANCHSSSARYRIEKSRQCVRLQERKRKRRRISQSSSNRRVIFSMHTQGGKPNCSRIVRCTRRLMINSFSFSFSFTHLDHFHLKISTVKRKLIMSVIGADRRPEIDDLCWWTTNAAATGCLDRITKAWKWFC